MSLFKVSFCLVRASHDLVMASSPLDRISSGLILNKDRVLVVCIYVMLCEISFHWSASRSSHSNRYTMSSLSSGSSDSK